ncbi:MAG: putative N-acetyltransferase YhbS [Phenylobacterium sp.]|jgi:predicted N-acetyltransferase YhbS
MKIKLLADEPGAINTIAQWYYDEWSGDPPEYNINQIKDMLKLSCNHDKVPLTLVAKEGDKLVGVAALKFTEMAMFPQYQHWLGGVYVVASERGKGIAAKMVTAILAKAKAAGVKTLYLQTDDHSGGVYLTLGFKPLKQVDNDGDHVLVMVAEL